ncbi:hypothetical protein GJAV_G00028990 [Gymnothorax javanicus]|nr:hypothetical protein GJAV_G00028990 [Gymnothorax javanicus]
MSDVTSAILPFIRVDLSRCYARKGAVGALGCEGHPITSSQTLAQNLYQGFSGAENWEVFPDSEKALQGCLSLGLQLGVVSNFDNRLKGILHSCGLLPYFSFLLTSEMAGVAKPDPAIFQQALQICGVTAASVAYIGDHFTKDYCTARSLGIHGYLIDRRGGNIHPEVPAQYRLCSLEELPMRLLKDAH